MLKVMGDNQRLNPFKLHDELLNFFINLNTTVMNSVFFGSELIKPNVVKGYYYVGNNRYNSVIKYPLFLSQIAILFHLNPVKYAGRLNNNLFNFLAKYFRDNIIFIVNKEGFLLYILIMQGTKQERMLINSFFNDNIDDIYKFQYTSTEYMPELEKYKLLTAKPKINTATEDIIMYFF